MKGKKITTAITPSVYAELSKVAGDITPNAGEDKTTFLVRLTEAVSALDDGTYDALSVSAQKWFNASGEAINANAAEKIPDLPGMPEIKSTDGVNIDEGETKDQTDNLDKEEHMGTKKAVKKTVSKKKSTTLKEDEKTTSLKKSQNKRMETQGKKPSKPNKPSTNAVIYVVSKSDSAKRGFMKDYISAAHAMKKFTRDALTAKVRGPKCDEKRALQYFYWCKRHKIFTPA